MEILETLMGFVVVPRHLAQNRFLLDGLGLRLNERSSLKLSITSVGARCSVFGRAHRNSTVGFLSMLVLSCFISVLYVYCFDALMSQKSFTRLNILYVYEPRAMVVHT